MDIEHVAITQAFSFSQRKTLLQPANDLPNVLLLKNLKCSGTLADTPYLKTFSAWATSHVVHTK